jgi:hypothetical protein
VPDHATEAVSVAVDSISIYASGFAAARAGVDFLSYRPVAYGERVSRALRPVSHGPDIDRWSGFLDQEL